MDSTSCSTSMVFHTQSSTSLLFAGWQVDTAGQYIGATVVIFLLALLREFIALVRSYRAVALAAANQISRQVGSGADVAALSVSSSTLPMQENAPTSLEVPVSGSSAPSLLARISRTDVRWQCVDSLLLVLHTGLSYLLMLLVMSLQLYVFLLVLISGFAAHALTQVLYKPWLDEWQHRQRDYLRMLEGGPVEVR
jgi:hypothetical protein